MNHLKRLLLLIIVLILHLYLLINTTFTLWPEMVVYPYLLNNKFLLYRDIINPYTPLFIEFLGVFSRHFGYQPLPYQVLTWGTILLIDLLIFGTSLKITNSFKRAIFATLFFATFSIPLAINGLWFDLVQTPFIIISIFLFYSYLQSKKIKSLFFASVSISIAFFIKQQSVWLPLSFIVIILADKDQKITDKIKKILVLLYPFLFLFSFSLVRFGLIGILQDYGYWAFYFPFVKSSHLSGYILLPNLKQVFIVILSFLILIPLFANKKSPRILFFFSFVLLLSAFPRFDYFHLIPSFSILSILASTLKFNFNKNKIIAPISISSIVLFSIFSLRFYQRNWNNNIRFFEEDIQTAATLIKFIEPSGAIYIQNGPDQIYPLSSTLPVKPWVDEFPWYLEKSDLQDRVVEALKRENPKILLLQPYSQTSAFGLGSYRPKKIADYLDQNYITIQKITNNLELKKNK